MEDYKSLQFRLGNVFNFENLEKLKKDLNELELSIIPYNVTLPEIQQLLAYQGNMLAYLHANLEKMNMAFKKQENICKETYNSVYNDIQKRNTDNKTTTIKNIASVNKRVLEEQKKLLDIQEIQATITARISAIQEQNVSLRKIASIQMLMIENGLE